MPDVYVDWFNKIIYIQRSFMIQIQTTPSEIFQLDLNELRLKLKELESSEEGAVYLDTHRHNPPVSVGGAVLARVIEFINGYTISFEEIGTPYRVETVGANSNISSVINLGSGEVSVSTSNSAGLQDLNSLQAASFSGEVAIDVTSPYFGTAFPIGTRGFPVNNLADALLIAESRGINTILILSSMTLSTSDYSEGYTFKGSSLVTVIVTLDPSINVSNCTFRDLTIQGTLDNANILKECNVLNIINYNGFIYHCTLSGTVTLAGGLQATILDCYSGVAGGLTAAIDMGGSGQSLAMRNYSGGIHISNRTGTDPISIDMSSGQIIIDNTVTNGDIFIRGLAKLTDNSTGTAVIHNELINNFTIAESVWDVQTSSHTQTGTYGYELATKTDIQAAGNQFFNTYTSGSIIFGTLNSGTIVNTVLRDNNYWTVNDHPITGLTVEFTFNLASKDHKAGNINVFGRYQSTGNPDQYIELWVWNVEASGWELMREIFMDSSTTDDEHLNRYDERHIDRDNSNEVKIRLIHNETTYTGSHALYMDYVSISSITVSKVLTFGDLVTANLITK